MLKKDLVAHFETAAAASRFIGIGPAQFCRLPDKLTTAQSDRVLGSFVRQRKPIPRKLRA